MQKMQKVTENLLPEKYVLGIIPEYKRDGVLYVYRSKNSYEYKKFWSIPTVTVDETIYRKIINRKKISSKLLQRISNETLGGTEIVGGELFIFGTRMRRNYIINIALFNVSLIDLPTQFNKKYDVYSIFQPAQVLSKNNGFCGTCISLYFQGLINNERLPSTFSYMEIPPEIADSERLLKEYTAEELWTLASPNYSLLLEDKTGGEGNLIRSLTLDHYLERFVNNYIEPNYHVLDLGCGTGHFLKFVQQKTTSIIGIDLYLDRNCNADLKNTIRKGNIENSEDLLNNQLFDFIFLNLMIFWLPDLDSVCSTIKKKLKPNGRILVTTTHPEYTKNGEWKKAKDNYYWITKEPLRRAPFLTMINRCVGPLWFYPRSTIEILKAFTQNKFHCIDFEEIFLDTYLSKQKLKKILLKSPSLNRHLKVPNFVAYIFKNSIGQGTQV